MLGYVFFEVSALNSEIASQSYTGDLPAVYALVDPASAYSQQLAYLLDCKKLLAVFF
jgi:hypothetical protein